MIARPMYEDKWEKPHLHFAVFGNFEELEKQSENNVMYNQDGIECLIQRAFKTNYLKSYIGNVVKFDNKLLYDISRNQPYCATISGSVENDRSLSYLKNITGFINELLKNGGVSVLDSHNQQLISQQEWLKKFSGTFDPIKHVSVCLSEYEHNNTYYTMFTRGMKKFGRPDACIHEIADRYTKAAKFTIDELTQYGILGGTVGENFVIKTPEGDLNLVLEYIDDLSAEMNNTYYEVSWWDVLKANRK